MIYYYSSVPKVINGKHHPIIFVIKDHGVVNVFIERKNEYNFNNDVNL